MSKDSQYLLWFANENIDFRRQEIESILHLFKIKVHWIDGPNKKPFWIVKFAEENDALKIASRSVTLRSIIKLWGYADALNDLHKNVQSYPVELMNTYLREDLSFRVEVVTFGKTFKMKEKVEKIEMFNYLPADGPVQLINPDVILFYIEYYGLVTLNIPDIPYHYYFGVWLCDGQRNLINKYSIKTRKFIGNTTMNPQLAFIMANQALVKPGDLVMDPFVGSGSLLAAVACFGGYVIGVDIDYLMLHGKSRPTRIQERSKPRANDESVYSNMKQYSTENQYVDVLVGDSSLPFWHERLQLDSIVTDPPYGIREATERIGSTKDYKISADHLQTHIPSKISYCLTQIFKDLLNYAVKHLKLKGRLVTWIPIYKKEYDPSMLPHHPCLQLVANSEQTLTGHTSRRLLTWEKIKEPGSNNEIPSVSEMFPLGFREHYFGHGETRKQRRARIAQELKNKSLKCSNNTGEFLGRQLVAVFHHHVNKVDLIKQQYIMNIENSLTHLIVLKETY